MKLLNMYLIDKETRKTIPAYDHEGNPEPIEESSIESAIASVTGENKKFYERYADDDGMVWFQCVFDYSNNITAYEQIGIDINLRNTPHKG